MRIAPALRSVTVAACALAAASSALSAGENVPALEHRVTVGYKRALSFVCMGKGSPVVVFENGLGDGLTTWQKVQTPVSKITTACTYDRAGSGFSDPPLGPVTAEAIADDLHVLLARAGIASPVVLVGHSAGGLYATVYADKYLSSVAGMVLVEPSFADQDRTFANIQSEFDDAEAEENNGYKKCEVLARARKIIPGGADECLPPMRPDRPAAYYDYLKHMRLNPNYWKTVRLENQSISTNGGAEANDSSEENRLHRDFGSLPLTVLTAGNFHTGLASDVGDVAAGHERTWRSGHDDLARRSTRGQSSVVLNSSHYIQIDQPQAVINAIQDVVAQARAGSIR
ncbi:MAG: alpha/beta fold hydrolase [Caulobacteraceae bacterium]